MATPIESINKHFYTLQTKYNYRSRWQLLHIDAPLLVLLLILVGVGLAVLYSASNQQYNIMLRQSVRMGIGFSVMFFIAQIPPVKLKAWAPVLFIISILLLLAVLIRGEIGKGAQRWLDLEIIRFQPSEIIKLSLPIMLAAYFHDKILPPKFKQIAVALLIILVPCLLTAKQPDLGTAVVIMMVGAAVLLFTGTSWRVVLLFVVIIALMVPILWHHLHDYQRARVMIFLNPESDPLGSGYHIIQSKIAIGSGGIFGKGWFKGTQSHLHFLPEDATDFIFAVCGEEFGFIGCIVLISLYFMVLLRGLFIACQAQDTFSRLLASSISVSFFLSAFINVGMVTGILPVVGLPLPLVSYGGTSTVIVMASLGVLMSIHCHRKLLA